MDWNKIYDILIETCQAPEFGRAQFVAEKGNFREYRFQGALGFGGKIYRKDRYVDGCWLNALTVNCYWEDSTHDRENMIAAANERLKEFWA